MAVSSPIVPAVRSSRLTSTLSTALSPLSTPAACTRHRQPTRRAPNDCPAPRVEARLRPPSLASWRWLLEVIPGLYPHSCFGVGRRRAQATYGRVSRAGVKSRPGRWIHRAARGDGRRLCADTRRDRGSRPGGPLRRRGVGACLSTRTLLGIGVLDGPPFTPVQPNVGVAFLGGKLTSSRLSVSSSFPS